MNVVTLLVALGLLPGTEDNENWQVVGQATAGAIAGLWQTISQRMRRRDPDASEIVEDIERGEASDENLARMQAAVEREIGQDKSFELLVTALANEVKQARRDENGGAATTSTVNAVGSIVHGYGSIKVDGDIVGGSRINLAKE